MKNTLKLLNIIILGAFLLVSCNKNDLPRFDDKNAFVAFDKASYTIDEDKVEQEVFVTLASVAGISTTVIYELVDGTAKKDINYKLVGDGKLTFTNEARTQSFKVTIIDNPEFTGDLNFGIRFSDTGTVSKGEADTCKVTISDLNHPLSRLFGDYTGSGVCNWQGQSTWGVKMSEDEDDVARIWIDNLPFVDASASGRYPIYGVVDNEKNTITIPYSQVVPDSDPALSFWGVSESFDFVKEGSLVLEIKDGGKTIGFPTDMGFALIDASSTTGYGIILPGNTSLVK